MLMASKIRFAIFNWVIDRIDLTDWGRVYSLDVMKLNKRKVGIVISYGD